MRHCIYLIPGFFGFANLGELKYFGHVRNFLIAHCGARGVAAEVHVVKTHPTASLPTRAAKVAETIARTDRGRRSVLHLIGHSSGGLDARLLVAPGVSLPTEIDVERLAERVRSLVSVSTPHRGTPLASFFAGMRGQELLRLLSLSTISLLRFGPVPIAAMLQLGGLFARLDNLTVNSTLLDELFGRLLANFSVGRRRTVRRLLDQVATDQALLLQLTAEGTDLFNAVVTERPGVSYGAVVTRSQPPGLGSTLDAGVDPSAQATHAIYTALYRLAARTPAAATPHCTSAQRSALRRAYGGRMPSARANDGVVPTLSQVWGEVIHAAQADHLDIIGHFRGPSRRSSHFDWLASGSGFTREEFESAWTDVADFLMRGTKAS